MSNSSVTWQWYPCDANIINYNPLNNTPLKLISNSPITVNNQQIQIQIDISMPKIFNFSQEIGWNWHKSWTIPDIQCKIQPQNNQNLDVLKQINLHASLFIVKTHYPSMQLVNIGCKGNTQQLFSSGQCTFKCLKFNSTSYNNERQSFQLVVVLTEYDDKQQQQIVCSRISSKVFVDSRKHARFQTKQFSLQSYIEPFLPENLDKPLTKRMNKYKGNSDIKIEPTLEGVINYFTAANIRHKIKHPLFLALRFRQCIKMYLDYEQFDSNQNLLEQISNKLMDSQQQNCERKVINLLIEINDFEGSIQRKALEIISLLENDKFNIYTKKSYLPEGLTAIENIEKIMSEYRIKYPYLVNQKCHANSNEHSKNSSQQMIKKQQFQQNMSATSEVLEVKIPQIVNQDIGQVEVVKKVKIEQFQEANSKSNNSQVLPQQPNFNFQMYQQFLLQQQQYRNSQMFGFPQYQYFYPQNMFFHQQ